MPCPKNANGQSVCQIIDHPDRVNESFCATCQRRFAQTYQGPNPAIASTEDSFGLLPIVLGVCMAFLIASIITEQPDPPPAQTARPSSEFSMGQQ